MAEPTEPRHRPRTGLALGIVAGALALVAIVVGVIAFAGGSKEPFEYKVVVPVGTAERIAGGEEVTLIDAQIDLAVGDRIVIDNQDDEVHQVGPFPVRPGETFEHTFTAPGRFEGLCTLHPDDAVVITIT
ncbi:MAG: hypothetical protein R2699_15135 [Acidimicrobiales bacterium]